MPTKNLPGQRGPADHAMRDKIVTAAHELFSERGFAATSVAEVAAKLDVAPTYLYKFFQSKTAIGQAVCNRVLSSIEEAIWRVARSSLPPPEKLKQLFSTILKESVGMFFAERRLHDLVALSLESGWPTVEAHPQEIRAVLEHILDEGIASGTFDSGLDREETIEALFWALHPFAHPRVLEQSIDGDLDKRAKSVARFCIRALEPRIFRTVTN